MPAGQPTILTPDLTKRFIRAFKRVWFLEPAAAAVGIPRCYLYRWIRNGEKAEKAQLEGREISPQDQLFLEFCGAYRKAVFQLEAECIKGIRNAGRADPKYWAALSFLLERKFAERWGKKESEELANLRAEFAAFRLQMQGDKKAKK